MSVSNEEAASIMIVDDTPANLELLSGILRRRGHRVLAFPRGDLALQAAKRVAPDLILLDVKMPIMDGFEVCEQLKAAPELANIPVIFISALGETGDKVRAFEVGAVDYVTKPFQFEEVQARVQTHLELRRRERELQESYRALRQLEELRDNLTHMLVHDMRSPLTSLFFSLDLLRDEIGQQLSSEKRRNLDDALEISNTLASMVTTLLDLSRLEAGEMPLTKEDTDLVEVIRSVQRSFAGMLHRRNVRFDLPESAVAHCDASVTERIVVNLLSNALKYTPSTASIEVSARREEESVVVDVKDTGPGIPKEFQERVFDKFSQARKDGKRNSSGLGLAFCKLAVEAHGGTITLVSEGEGCTFSFTLPPNRGSSGPQ